MKKKIIAIAEIIGCATPYIAVAAILAAVALIGAYFAWGFEQYAVINAVMAFSIAAVVCGVIGIPVAVAWDYISMHVIAGDCADPDADPNDEEI
jgi:hypothetical protein